MSDDRPTGNRQETGAAIGIPRHVVPLWRDYEHANRTFLLRLEVEARGPRWAKEHVRLVDGSSP